MKKARIIFVVWCILLGILYIAGGFYLFAGMGAVTAALFLISLVSTKFLGKELELSLRFSEAARKGETFKGRIEFENKGFFPVFYGMCHLKWENTLTQEAGKIKLPFSVGSHKKAEVSFEGRSIYCGVCYIYVEKLEIFDFFKIFCKKIKKDREANIILAPECMPISMELLSKEAYDMESFRYSSKRSGDDTGETFDIRTYRPGDSIKQIHWKLTGKLDNVVVKEMSYPVYDSVLLLPELYYSGERTAEKRSAAAEVFASVAMSFLNRRIPFETGFYDGKAEKFYMERIENEEDFWNVIFLFLRTAKEETSPHTIREYLENYGARSFAHYIYITAGNAVEEEEMLRQIGEVTVLRCADTCELSDKEIWFTPENWSKELAPQESWR